jgi:hypothetical protein
MVFPSSIISYKPVELDIFKAARDTYDVTGNALRSVNLLLSAIANDDRLQSNPSLQFLDDVTGLRISVSALSRNSQTDLLLLIPAYERVEGLSGPLSKRRE